MLKPSSSKVEKSEATFTFKESASDAASKLKEFFSSEGYKLESGEDTSGTYGKGNDILQFLLGAFVKRFKFPFEISEKSGKTTLVIKNGTGSKVIGGAIGIARHNKEFKRVVELLGAKVE
jgi:hypothetical protein